ncbi:uncharacterized protein LOC126882192 [Diabrotica virgifera virgifera]|uniref:Reverse transcriptase domain-containing protein n=1 Tax=Diabrotica virgifera virgifera TaxID=50390 RepID=A0ABM5JYE4_DIAVI|nr:uncharacterized protein LOC126882192 [Diabrotica virgifera virgifera]
MGFYNTIRVEYGEQSVRFLKDYQRTNLKLAKERNRRLFLLSCRSKGITPNHICHATTSVHNYIHRNEFWQLEGCQQLIRNMGFYNTIRVEYGEQSVRFLKDYQRTNLKLAKERNRRLFLLSCRSKGITPNHICHATTSVHNYIHRNEFWQLEGCQQLIRLDSKLLNVEIATNHKNLKKLENSLSLLKNNIIQSTSENIWLQFSHTQSINYNKLFFSIKSDNLKKIDTLYQSCCKTFLKTDPKWIKNLSTSIIPNDILGFLALGNKFSIEPKLGKDLQIKSLLADLEQIISSLPSELEQNSVRARSTNIITNHILNTSRSSYTFFNNLYFKTRQFLKSNPDLVVTKADKGNVTVILDKTQYLELCSSLIDNDGSYKPISSDPTPTLQRKCNALISSLAVSKQIDNNTKKKLTTYNGTIAKFYALPKIHKPILSVRPIVASIGTPTEYISAFVTDILTKAYDYENRYYVKDSFQMVEKFNGYKLPDNYVLVSLDVVSLFSNVYLRISLMVIEANWDRIGGCCSISFDNFINIVEFLFTNTYFSFNNKFYQQTFGTPMGAKISPIIAAYVMDYVLDTVIPVLSFNIPFIKKYVDDIILAVPSDKTDELLNTFNSFIPNIQFTIEKEDTNFSVPFLDIRMIRDANNIIKIDWYQKPTHSGRYLNYHSYHKHSTKVNLVKQMKSRVIKLSDPSFHNKNLQILTKLFISNSYPTTLINKILFNTVHNEDLTPSPATNNVDLDGLGNDRVSNTPTLNRYFSIPYIKDITPGLTRIFNNLESNNNNNDNHFKINVAFRSALTINNLFSKVKDKTEIGKLSNIVYKVPCSSCNKSYIGQTSQLLKFRITLHKSDSRLQPDRCALAKHVHTTGHSMDFENTLVLHQENNKFKREFIEMSYIFLNDSSINVKGDFKNLSDIYHLLLRSDTAIDRICMTPT